MVSNMYYICVITFSCSYVLTLTLNPTLKQLTSEESLLNNLRNGLDSNSGATLPPPVTVEPWTTVPMISTTTTTTDPTSATTSTKVSTIVTTTNPSSTSVIPFQPSKSTWIIVTSALSTALTGFILSYIWKCFWKQIKAGVIILFQRLRRRGQPQEAIIMETIISVVSDMTQDERRTAQINSSASRTTSEQQNTDEIFHFGSETYHLDCYDINSDILNPETINSTLCVNFNEELEYLDEQLHSREDRTREKPIPIQVSPYKCSDFATVWIDDSE